MHGARIPRGDGPRVWVDAFTQDAPGGERREIVPSTWGGESPAEELERAGIVASADELGQ